jgi:hypothetical protein
MEYQPHSGEMIAQLQSGAPYVYVIDMKDHASYRSGAPLRRAVAPRNPKRSSPRSMPPRLRARKPSMCCRRRYSKRTLGCTLSALRRSSCRRSLVGPKERRPASLPPTARA